MNTKLNYWEHIPQRVKKAGTTTLALSMLMSNLNGPKSSRRKLLMPVTHSILLYGAEIWVEALDKDIYAKDMIRDFSEARCLEGFLGLQDCL